MLRRDLGFLISRMMAVFGFIQLLTTLTELVRLLWLNAMEKHYPGDAKIYAIQISVEALVTLALAGAVWFLWFHAERFGTMETQPDRTIRIDTRSLRITAVFAIGLYMLLSGSASLIGIFTEARLAYTVPLYGSLSSVRWYSFVHPGLYVLFGLAMLLTSAKPQWLQNLSSLARADYGQEEDVEGPTPHA